MSQSHNHENDCCSKSVTATQSLDEMDFERGIWNAGKISYFLHYKLCARKIML